MSVEEDSKGLDPGEVPLHVVISPSNEVSIDVKIGIRNYAEVSVLFAVEVEADSIRTHESWVLTN